MATDRNRSRLLRRLAEEIVAQIPDEVLTSARPDLATSLARQWLTYDGHATLIVGEEQHYYQPAIGPAGELRFNHHPVPIGTWFRGCMEDWEFGEEELGRAVRQLNIGQAAGIENRRGAFLRLWVNPRERSRGVEQLGPRNPNSTPAVRDYAKIARRQIDSIYPEQMDPRDKADLVASVARQVQLHDGHALILRPKSKFHIVLAPQPDGMLQVSCESKPTPLFGKLLRCGLTPDEAAHLLHLINLGMTPEVTDELGRRCRVVAEPKTGKVSFELVGQPSATIDSIQWVSLRPRAAPDTNEPR
jgi:hypothetical protein